ncbi:MAG: hypothetical protein V1916_01630 [Patescibacteria group bacterium]
MSEENTEGLPDNICPACYREKGKDAPDCERVAAEAKSREAAATFEQQMNEVDATVKLVMAEVPEQQLPVDFTVQLKKCQSTVRGAAKTLDALHTYRPLIEQHRELTAQWQSLHTKFQQLSAVYERITGSREPRSSDIGEFEQVADDLKELLEIFQKNF